MAIKTLKETVDDLVKIPGKVRGEVFLSHADYIKKREGRGGLKKMEETLSYFGHPVNFKKVKPSDWISEGISSAVVVAAKEIFYWEEKDVFEMGKAAPRLSPGLKLIVRSIVSPQRLFEEAPVYWENLFDFGLLEPVSFSENEKEALIRIKGYKTHPLLCIYHAGYIQGLAEFALQSKKIAVKETACVHKENSHDEFKITWK